MMSPFLIGAASKSLLATVNLASIPLPKIKQYQKDLIDNIKSTKPEILEGIRTTKELSPENEAELKEVLSSFAASYAG